MGMEWWALVRRVLGDRYLLISFIYILTRE
jgi:hypothetical protein